MGHSRVRAGASVGGVWGAVAGGVLGALAGVGLGIGLDKARKKLDEKFNNKDLALTLGGAGSMLVNDAINKIIPMPFPDRPLPRDPDTDEPLPDSLDPHTQLGHRQGAKEKYPQAREFGPNGELVRDIDFTDHSRPNQHTLPHQHPHNENATGGTKERGKPEPVPEWDYEKN